MGRAPCCDKANVKKGPWSPEEDTKLKEYIQTHGTGGNWIALPQKAGLRRCGKSCRLRWLNYLRPNIKHGEFSDDEDRLICALFSTIGSRWSIMAAQLPGRTDNDIKNYWNTKLKKKMMMNTSCLIPADINIRKQQPLHHHLYSFDLSTNYSFPSLSTFHNSNINNHAPPSSPPPSSSYMYDSTTNTSSSSYHDQTTLSSIPSSPTTTAAAAAASALQSEDQHAAAAAAAGYLLDSSSAVGSMKSNNYLHHQGVTKDNSTLNVMFGGGDHKAAAISSTCNSDHGSTSAAGHVYADHHNKAFGGVNNYVKLEKGYSSSCYGDQFSLDSCLEEIKQLISTTNLCSMSSSHSLIDNMNLNFFVDESKEQVEKVMMYY